MMYVADYRHDPALSGMFFELAADSFGLDLRAWAARGSWGDSYVCHSLVEGGRMVANASTSRMKLLGGAPVDALQIGTVCTRPEYRNRGCARLLLERIIEEAGGRGLFLFANPQARGLYLNLGFAPAPREIAPRVELPRSAAGAYSFRRGSVSEAVRAAAGNAVYARSFDVRTIPGLAELYLNDFYSGDIWVCDEVGVCAVWAREGEALTVRALYGARPCAPDRLLRAMAATGARHAEFQFMPDGWGIEADMSADGPDEMFTMGLELPGRIAFPELMRA